MKKRRKTHYMVWVPNMWWGGKKSKWICSNQEEFLGVSISSHRHFRTARRARRCALSCPSGTVLTQSSFKHGRRIVKEYERT